MKHIDYFKKSLDKRDILLYNINKESIPVDGLLPMVIKNNRLSFAAVGRLFPFIAILHDTNNLADKTK